MGGGKNIKNLWSRKCVRRAIFWNTELKVPFNPYLVCNMAARSLRDCQRSSYTKNEYNLFYQKLDAESFFIRPFFRKKAIFPEKTMKNCFGNAFEFFRERRCLAPKINITFFIINEVLNILLFNSFSKKKKLIFWENGKKPFLEPKSLLKGRKRLATKMNIIFFLREMRFWIFFRLTIFSKKVIFLEKMRKTILVGLDHFLGEGVIMR